MQWSLELHRCCTNVNVIATDMFANIVRTLAMFTKQNSRSAHTRTMCAYLFQGFIRKPLGFVCGASRRVALSITTFIFVWRALHVYAHDLRVNNNVEVCANPE